MSEPDISVNLYLIGGIEIPVVWGRRGFSLLFEY